jgi:hypothetical protein
MRDGPRVAILQSAYIPWKGYFDIIGTVDHFVLYDDVQFRKRHWHNRNRITGPDGPLWLTIPVATKGDFHQPIDEVLVAGAWAAKHWRTIEVNYARAPFFHEYRDWLRGLFEHAGTLTHLTAVNELFLRALCERLAITTPMQRSSALGGEGRATDRLLALCRTLGAGIYLTGPSARDYLEVEKFAAAGIAVEWMDYSGYPEYPQVRQPFEHALSVIDLILNTGPEARRYMKSPA